VRPDRHVELPDTVVTEEPMEIRVAGPGQPPSAVAVTMRTPGHDFELAAGFLITEGLVTTAEISRVAYCDGPEGPPETFNAVTVSVTRSWTPVAERRPFVAGSSCGICGKASIDQVEIACPVLPPTAAVPAALLSALPGRMRAAQQVFDRTGGLHAAAAFGPDAALIVVREDVGRHNAVDKVAGHFALQRNAPPSPAILMVSGRISFEIVQKAAMAGLPIIAAVSAPSSLAVQAASRLGVTVAGFVRDGTYTLYSHPERVSLP
jgi:FdhD protein